jgi:hypothetical protein
MSTSDKASKVLLILKRTPAWLNKTSAGYEGLRAEELMPDLGPRASRGSTIGTLNLVGGAPIAALEGHWRRIHVHSEDAAKTKGNHGSRQSLCLALPFALTAQTLT